MLRQGLHQKLLLKLSPQQIQLMKLLQVPTMQLEQRIKEELEANPALEEGLSEDDEPTSTADDEVEIPQTESTDSDTYHENDGPEKEKNQ